MASAVKANGNRTPEKQLITPQNQKQLKKAVSSANKGGQEDSCEAVEAAATAVGAAATAAGATGMEEDASHKLRGYLQVKHNPQNASGIKGRSRILRKVRYGK